MTRAAFILLSSASVIVGTLGHGRLEDPPGRNTMWRQGFDNPVNYNDDEVFCGGFGVQYLENDGKCGVCGDPWHEEQPRENEHGGKYGNGVVGRRYVMGQTIDIRIVLSTNHWGSFELKLCPMDNDPDGIADQECMDKHPLEIVQDADENEIEQDQLQKGGSRGPRSSHYQISEDTTRHNETFWYRVKLPPDVACRKCVMQWTYTTGNSWGECEDGGKGTGEGQLGCGPQEMFRNCADVAIVTNTVGFPPMPEVRKRIDDIEIANRQQPNDGFELVSDEDQLDDNNNDVILVY